MSELHPIEFKPEVENHSERWSSAEVLFPFGQLEVRLSEAGRIVFSAWSKPIHNGPRSGFGNRLGNCLAEFEVKSKSCLVPAIYKWVTLALQGEYQKIPVEFSCYRSPFQRRVVEALTQEWAHERQPLSYKRLAEKLNQPKASRAVGRALATNPFVFFRPCHLVIPGATASKIGAKFEGLREVFYGGSQKLALGGYQGGSQIKEHLLMRDFSKVIEKASEQETLQ